MNDYSPLFSSILGKLSVLSMEQLQQVDDFLAELGAKSAGNEVENKTLSYQKTMALAGSWKDMSEEDFQEYLAVTTP